MTAGIINWFQSYLPRTQVTKYGHVLSDCCGIDAGIALGTVLGPLIYILYVNDCMNVLDRCKITMFADDCVLYYSANN